MKETEITQAELEKIKKSLESIRYGSVTIIVQDGKIVQLEKLEKERLR